MSLDGSIRDQEIIIGRETYTVGDLFGVSLEEINDHFATQAGRLAYLGMQLARAEVTYDTAKSDREALYADIDLDVREGFDVKAQKYTESKIRAMVITTEDYHKALEEEHKALHNYKMLRAIVEAMRQRGDMLISLGAQLRQEYDVTSMSIRDTKRKLRDAK